ncbi:hypothetical protein ACQCT3_18115 [Sutcliffiella horikoshii]|uniref:hypothetical protein n=1 Tax=Sutcliffiella horikoshii TaxID=79883 RepID=UPI003CF6238D
MKKVIDFMKVLEEKKQAINEITEENAMEILLESHKKISGSHEHLYREYVDLFEKYKELVGLYVEAQDSAKIKSYQHGLMEHFIVKNGLEEDYVFFLNDVNENEDVKDYQKAAQKQLESYRVKDGEVEEFYIIEDEYGWMKEEELEEMKNEQ